MAIPSDGSYGVEEGLISASRSPARGRFEIVRAWILMILSSRIDATGRAGRGARGDQVTRPDLTLVGSGRSAPNNAGVNLGLASGRMPALAVRLTCRH